MSNTGSKSAVEIMTAEAIGGEYIGIQVLHSSVVTEAIERRWPKSVVLLS